MAEQPQSSRASWGTRRRPQNSPVIAANTDKVPQDIPYGPPSSLGHASPLAGCLLFGKGSAGWCANTLRCRSQPRTLFLLQLMTEAIEQEER